jgi:hypothetical protein
MANSLQVGGVDVEALLALASQLGEVPDTDAAVAVSLNSGKLEEYFRLMRERAQAIRQGLTAKAEMKSMSAPPPEAEEPEKGVMVRESSRVAEFFRGDAGRQPPAVPLAQFFQTVTQSIVDAQSALDLQSLSYARQLQGTLIPPVHFSIPNVHAEVKMGFNVDDPSNLLVRLFGKPEDSSNYGETTVSFDVAASPPPPGSEFRSPVPMFLVVPPERDRVLTAARVPAAWSESVVLLKNSAGGALSDAKARYLAIALHDELASIYRISETMNEPPRLAEVNDPDAVKALADIAAILSAWLRSVTVPPANP